MRRVAFAALLAVVCLARATQAQEPPAAASVVIVPSTSSGVDELVGRFVDRALQRGSAARGYASIVDAAPAGGAAPSLTALWNRVHLLRVEHALHAAVSARDEQYVVAVKIASRDGSGPRRGEVTAGQRELEAAVAAWVEKTLPAPSARAASTTASSATPAPAPSPTPAAAPASDEPSWRVALRDELVLGLGEDDFVGVLVGGGADYRIDDALWLGLRLVYANLPGRDERAQASLWYAQLEHRTDVSGRIAVPLRLGLGYLAANGSVLRLTVGLALDVGRGVGLQLDLLAPTFWVTPDRTLFSMSLGLEASLVF